MPWRRVPEFLANLRTNDGTAERCLLFVILTAAIFSGSAGAAWDEMNLRGAVWTIPALRAKPGRQHRVHYPQQLSTSCGSSTGRRVDPQCAAIRIGATRAR